MSETNEPYVIEMENGPDIVAYSAAEVAYLRQAAAGNAWLLEPGAEERLLAGLDVASSTDLPAAADTLSRAADPREVITDALAASLVQWWQTPPKLPVAADAVLAALTAAGWAVVPTAAVRHEPVGDTTDCSCGRRAVWT